MKYVALLRGINVGGKNRVPMAELKACFESLGFTDVQTYINSGNVIFEAFGNDPKLIHAIESAIASTFGFSVVVCVLSAAELESAMRHVPTWWGSNQKEEHSDAMFVIPPTTPSEVFDQVGEIRHEYEKVSFAGQVIFWTAPLKTYSRTRFSKIVGTPAYKRITIRNANTARKLLELATK